MNDAFAISSKLKAKWGLKAGTGDRHDKEFPTGSVSSPTGEYWLHHS